MYTNRRFGLVYALVIALATQTYSREHTSDVMSNLFDAMDPSATRNCVVAYVGASVRDLERVLICTPETHISAGDEPSSTETSDNDDDVVRVTVQHMDNSSDASNSDDKNGDSSKSSDGDRAKLRIQPMRRGRSLAKYDESDDDDLYATRRPIPMERSVQLLEPLSQEYVREPDSRQFDARLRQMNVLRYMQLMDDKRRLRNSRMRSSPLHGFLHDNQRILTRSML